MHWPRYIKLSLILPASASVAPSVLAFRARSEPAISTTVRVLPSHFPLFMRCLRFTSTQKNPWLRELTALLPVPATFLSTHPFSKPINAPSREQHPPFGGPATTFLSGLSSVLLKSKALLRGVP